MSSLAAAPTVLRSRFDRLALDESRFRTGPHGAAVPLSTVNLAEASSGAWETARSDRVGPNDVPALVSTVEGAA
jgi:hypothetical protein